MCLERLGGGRRRAPVVQLLDQPVGRNDGVPAEQEDRQQRALARAAELDGASAAVDLERAQDPKVHRRNNRL